MTEEMAALNKERVALFKPMARDYLQEAPSIPQALLESCKIHSDRQELIKNIARFLRESPQKTVIAEIGIQDEEFADYLITEIEPSRALIAGHAIPKPEEAKFILPPNEAVVQFKFIEGNSHEAINLLDNHSIDMAYIGASHALEVIRQGLALISTKIKPGGFLVCSDYTSFSFIDTCSYGMPRAFNEFVTESGWPVIGFSLDRFGYHDIAAQKPI